MVKTTEAKLKTDRYAGARRAKVAKAEAVKLMHLMGANVVYSMRPVRDPHPIRLVWDSGFELTFEKPAHWTVEQSAEHLRACIERLRDVDRPH